MNSKKAPFYKNPVFWLFLTVSGMFGVLFVRFILGEYAYFYQDIGWDTFHINYPLYSLFSDYFHNGGYSDYTLRVGFGMDISSYLYQYLNPLNLLVVLLPERLIPWTVLLATYLKLVIMAMAAYTLFVKWLRHAWAAFGSAVLWTFSGYVMLWGQHYGFCTSLMLFTVFLLLVHLYVEDGEKSRNALLVLWITLMLFSNYYFLYISGAAGAVYILIYLIWKKEKPLQIIRKLAGLAGMGILGICMGGTCLISVCNIFLGSVRSESAVSSTASYLLSFHNWKEWLTILGRFFSNNTFGVGNDYVASSNYYEAIMLSVSAIVLPAVIYLLYKKETRRKTLFLLALSAVMLSFPLTGQLLNLSGASLRWSFLLCLFEVLAAGLFIRDILTHPDLSAVRRSFAISGAVWLIGCGILLAAGYTSAAFRVNALYLVLYALFLLAYFLLIRKGSALFRKKKSAFTGAFLALLCVEMVVVNFPTINFRHVLTRDQINNYYYNDGTAEAWEALSELDPSVYRVGKNYVSMMYNDSIAQGYPGFSVYLSTIPSALIDIKERFEGEGYGNNVVCFSENNTPMYALLGMKYLIADSTVALPSDDFSYVTSVGNYDIYQYENGLPFGYLYDQIWDLDEIEEMSDASAARAVLSGFYFTEEAEDTDHTEYAKAELGDGETVSLLDGEMEAVNCSASQSEEGVLYSDMEEDPQIIWKNIGDSVDDGLLHRLTVKVDPDSIENGKVTMAIYYATDGNAGFNAERSVQFKLRPDKAYYSIWIPSGVTDIRVDVDSEENEILLKSLTITSYPSEEAAYQELRKSKVTDTVFTDGTYQATVENDETTVQMLCVPLVYTQGWSASIDGETVELYNINGGLCGVEIPSGTHEVTLQYEAPHKQAGIALSLGGIALYLLIFGGAAVRRRVKK